MKKSKRTVVVFVVALLVVCTACLALTACNHGADPEKRPFSMSISNPDGVFNPFFSTSAYDSNIISLTQIGMLSTDKNGKIVYGENEPTVVKDMTDDVDPETGNTIYRFLLKNGIKWSDGEPLTYKDVLFNLYVYLDPAYTGSATIYSTDIVGLQNYRLQSDTEGDISSSEVSAFEETFVRLANKRVDDDVNFVKFYSDSVSDENKIPLGDDIDEKKLTVDYAKFAKTFLEELNSDWNNINVEDYDWRNKDNMSSSEYNEYAKYIMTEKWQIFLVNDGGYSYLYLHNDETGGYAKYDGNVLFNQEEAENVFIREILPELIERGLATEHGNINDDDYSYTLKNGTEEEKKVFDKAMQEICVSSVFKSYFSRSFPTEIITDKNLSWSEVYKNDTQLAKLMASIKVTNAKRFEDVARYSGSAATMLAQFTAEEKSDYFTENGKMVKSIRGITVEHKVTQFNKVNYGSEEFDVLQIEINGIDPKAIYNFAFNVAPMHYYSTPAGTTWNGKNYVSSFNEDPEVGEFGLEFGDVKFMEEVINASSKIDRPVGAGPYKAIEGGRFFDDNLVNYERNTYFETVGEQLSNAKIKYVRYKVVDTDKIISSLTSGDIDFGDPSATDANIKLAKGSKLNYKTVETNGYGYVGINPRFVPDITVRRAIMKAMNAERIHQEYYKGDLCEIIKRPMSSTNWAYPDGATDYKYEEGTYSDGITPKTYAFDATGYIIKEMLEEAGYKPNGDGVLHKVIGGGIDDVLDYKFTIAGGSTDHPAYNMFLEAVRILNSVGCNFRVVTSQTALTDLSAGKLEVWAAAWSSTIDPDMYQVYHMDSQASSTKNWGYAQILGQTNADAWGDEYDIVVRLSKLIDDGRNTLDIDERIEIYSRALDTVMELAVEFPTYQRKDLSVFNNMLDRSTLTADKDVTPYNGLLARMWEINYKK